MSFQVFMERQKETLKQYGSVGRFPLEGWEPHMFFVRCKDETLHAFTHGNFQLSRAKGTHSLFVLKTNRNFRHECCPCSSKNAEQNGRLYIKKGCQLHNDLDAIKNDTFILDRLKFSIPVGSEFKRWFGGMACWGVVPEDCIKKIEGEELSL